MSMHPSKEYRSNSPGLRLVPYFLANVPAKPGESIIDLGCGTGKAGAELARNGFEVWLYDHVNASEVNLPFTLGNLWNIPERFTAHWFYCCDVMEHIPPEKVDDVLDNIARVSTRGGFFQIALFDSEWFGEVLHLTVMPQLWWIEKLMKRWATVTVSAPEKGRVVAVVQT